MQVDYLWNADLPPPPPAGRALVPEDWGNAAVASDQGKQAIMRTLRRWGEDWRPRVAAVLPISGG